VRGSVLVLSLTLAAATATAGERPRIARFQAGGATIHKWGQSGAWAQAQVGRSFMDGGLSADLGLTGSGSDEGYASLTTGLEVLPLSRTADNRGSEGRSRVASSDDSTGVGGHLTGLAVAPALGLLLLSAVPGLLAEDAVGLPPGARVRVTAPPLAPEPLVGTVESSSGQSDSTESLLRSRRRSFPAPDTA
jgi:hypothetical protein